MAPLLATAVATYKQKRFDAAALEAMKAHDARIQIVPVEAKLNANDMAILTKNPRQFDFSLWHGLPQSWIDECFGEELGKRLVKIKLIKVEPRPAEQPPTEQRPVAQPPVEQHRVTKPPYLDLEVAEAAGFHRAMDIWSQVLRYGTCGDAEENLRRQAARLADILTLYDIEDVSSLPDKFKGFRTLRCPDRVSQEADPRRLIPQSSYYDVFLNILNRRQLALSQSSIV